MKMSRKLLSIFILFSLIVPVALAEDYAPSIPYIISGSVISEGQPVDGFDLIIETNVGTFNCAIENGDYGKNFMCLISINSCKLNDETNKLDCPETVFYIKDNVVGRTKQVVPGERGELDFDVLAEYVVIEQPESPQPQNNGGGGSSGGGGGGAAPPVEYDFSEYEEAEYTFSVAQNYAKQFTLDGETDHTLTVSKVEAEYVELIIKSEPIKITLSVGSTRRVDVDTDGVNDIQVTLDKIVADKAYITLSKYFVPEVDLVENQNAVDMNDNIDEKESNDQESFVNSITGALIASPSVPIIGSVSVMALLLVTLFFFRKRNFQNVAFDNDEQGEDQWNKDLE